MEDVRIKDLKYGKFYNMKHQDAERLAQRCFQIFDRDAAQKITKRNIRLVLVQCYKGINPKFKPSNEDINMYLKMVGQKEDAEELEQEDYLENILDYFESDEKKAPQQSYTNNMSLFELDYHENLDKQKQ